MIESLLVANRGEIARRIIRTANRLGIRTIAVYSEADADLPFVREADEAVAIGPANPAQSYRNADAIMAAAKSTGARAIHPGYGFLSENADFARTVEANGLVWVGPGAEAISAMGDKINARNLMAAAGVPVAPGSPDPAETADAALGAAATIGFPVMVKAAAGGGGMGMSVATDEAELRKEFEKVRAFAERMFGDGSVLIERYFPRVRHVEVQILGLADGRVVALSERECSVQRRNQKLVEEAPSPAVSPELRERLLAAAVKAGEAVGYRNAGTVECLFDPATGDFFFLEMNTRLQVEHPITELIHGIDLVEQQLRIASGLEPTLQEGQKGHAIELRINAEDPKRFLPGPGKVATWVEPAGEGVRVDSGYAEGTTVTPFYDSLMAKLIVFGADRDDALAKARGAVAGFQIAGPKNNLPFFAELLENQEFLSGDYDTGIVARMR
ncbi:putative acetyl-CoA carboxylase alpha subunit [Actinoplanes missouriensis 431]|uniref:biotin carboxylase n=1 Tax=Actinoplanes missouriensis (strain ATCC 14538 / DSM 43046 / CBS 188.64 / JCM 3121 / NBRC 102363 / NCIMB 12654 / NRRL B-3342 / UNCC 431) TaxID=512565 RepID=I0GWV8_ACTM4|nr:biotin carboxylase N-terminal domain-containing protein [Actinoplanes missouriensis]BAL85245.1 putative acetyl-CoA carboxylase alpha subunit [Actinoplanes missouriensis 431]